MRLLYKFPSRERPEKFFACLDNIISNALHPDYVILATLDVDDKTMANREVRDRILSYGDKIVALYGISHNKINAVNRDTELVPKWDVLIVMSDDFWFEKKGFDLDIIKAAQENPDCLLHFPDGHVNEKLITMAIMDRAYYSRFGYIYNPSYQSVYADNEQMEVAKRLGRHRYFNIRLFTHKHPIWGYGKPDALLKKTEDKTVYAADHLTFQKRKKKNFDLK